MLVAVAVLFSVSYWLISKVEAAKWQRFIKEKVTAALERGGGRALAMVAFLAVYREGAETALFYQALFNEGQGNGLPITVGILVGFAVLAVIFTLFYRFGVRIPLRPFFATTSVLLYYMAFVFAGKGVRELQEGNAVPITVLPGFPHVDTLGLYPTVETLLTQVWGAFHAKDTGYLRLYFAQLRKKLEPVPAEPRYLVTELGMGYRFVPDGGAPAA